MRAADYAPKGPLERVPAGAYVPPGQRADALADALRGVELGAYDEQIVAWMVRMLDDPTLRTIVSLALRVRETERQTVADEHQAKIRQVFDEESRIPAAERGSPEVEEAYRDGMVRVVSALGFMGAVPPRDDAAEGSP